MIRKVTAASLMAVVIAAAPVALRAQESATNAPAPAPVQSVPAVQPTPATQPVPPPHKPKKHDHSVFTGTLSDVDTSAMTLKVGSRTFEITSETKITKDGLPATLSDGVKGEPVSGTYKKDASGKLTAMSIHLGGKPDGEKKKKKKANSESSGSSTNNVPN